MKQLLSILTLLLIPFLGFGQGVLIGKRNAEPNKFAKLEVYSTNSGLLIPRLTTQQRLAIKPDATANGLLVYDNTTNSFFYFDSKIWKPLQSEVKNSDTVKIDNSLLKLIEQLRKETNNTFTLVFDKRLADSIHFGNTLVAIQNNLTNYINSQTDSLGRELAKTETVLGTRILRDSIYFSHLIDSLSNLKTAAPDTLWRMLERRFVADSIAVYDSIATLRSLIKTIEFPKLVGGSPRTTIVPTLELRPEKGILPGDLTVVEENGSGYRETFIWSDINADTIGDVWMSIDISERLNGYDVYWFKNSSSNEPDLSAYNKNTAILSNARDFTSTGFEISKGYSGYYALAFPANWKEPQFFVNNIPVADGNRRFVTTINKVNYQVWTFYFSVSSTYGEAVKLTAQQKSKINF